MGAGVAGLAVARALRGSGAEVEVVERAAAPAVGGAGIFLPANAVRGLRLLGLEDAVLGSAVPIARQEVADHRGRLLYQVGTDSVWQGIAPTVATHRAALHAALLDGAGHIGIRWGTGPASIVPDGPEADVTLDDGTSGRYDLVVGADGAHSTVRRLVFGDAGLRPSGLHAWRFLAPRGDTEAVWSCRLGRGVTFLTFPIGPDLVYHYLDASADDAGAGLDGLVARFGAPVAELVAAATVAHSGPIEEVSLAPWSRGPVLLVGDAAHATTPSMAQGAAMAFEDALVLADVLGRTASVPDALREYEERRRPRVERVQEQTRRRDRTRGLHPAARNGLLRVAGERLFRANYRGLHPAP
ncbi:FAD-dependent monooxygenase [Promicromonospora sukumoe]|uniref:FAD-dependent monooxygenase n=1 Tax=Promicromonospora sukumoe TaxID=88382 RepID=UPI0003797FD3|nr:FAD-dependent monooxygenase [Promicromonospora sukumoe]